MAFVPTDETQNQPQQPGTGQAPITTAAAPGAGPQQGKSANPNATPGQPFQNLSAYLTANQPQINQQAQTIAQGLTNQYGQITNDINNAAADFGTQVQSGYGQPNQDLTNEAAANPSAFISNPSNVAAFNSLYNDTYTGPNSFESTAPYGTVQNEVTNAAQNAALTNTIPGLETYFQSQNPNATKGGNILDAVLLQGSPEAQATIANAAKPYQSLQDYLTGQTTTADQGVQTAQQAAANEAQTLQNQFTGTGGIAPSFAKTLADEFSTAQKEYQDELAAAQDPNYQKNVAILNSEYGSNYPTYDKLVAPTLESVATPDEYAMAQALGQLMGEQFTSPLPGERPAGTNEWFPTTIPNLPPIPGTPLTPSTSLPPIPQNGTQQVPTTPSLTQPGQPLLFAPPNNNGNVPTVIPKPLPTNNTQTDRQNQDVYAIVNGNDPILHGMNLNNPTDRASAIQDANQNPDSPYSYIGLLNNGIPKGDMGNPTLVKNLTDKLNIARALARLGIIDANKLSNPQNIWNV